MPWRRTQRLFPRLSELRALHPTLHIDIDTAHQAEARLGDNLDAAIVLSQGPDPTLHAVQLDHNSVHAITSRALADALGPVPDEAKLAKQTFLVHADLPASFEAWKKAIGLPNLEPVAVDHFDSGQLLLEAAAQGLGIAIMHDDHYARTHDERIARLYDIEVASPYSYWFVCRPRALLSRPVRLFHEWLIRANL
jgi:LysR family glycine cleavage system transcriptional activator